MAKEFFEHLQIFGNTHAFVQRKYWIRTICYGRRLQKCWYNFGTNINSGTWDCLCTQSTPVGYYYSND